MIVGIGAEGVAHLPHEHRCGEATAGDVSDRDLHDPVAAAHDVVPVAADFEPCAACLVVAEQLDAVDHRQLLREQAALQAHGDVVLVLEAARASQRLRGFLGVPSDVGLLRMTERALALEEQAERPDRPRPRGSQRRAVERAVAAAESCVQFRQLVSHLLLVLERERDARLVRAGAGPLHRELGRLRALGQGTVPRSRELEAETVFGFQRNDRQRGGEGRRQRAHEASCDLGGQRCGAQRMRELASLSRALAQILRLAPGAQQEPADEAERRRRCGCEQGEREQEAMPSRSEHIRSRSIDRDRPARDLRGGEGHQVVGAVIQPSHAREEPDLIPLELPLQRGVARTGESGEQCSPGAIQHREAAVAKVERCAVEPEAVDQQRSREHAADAAVRVACRNGHHEDVPGACDETPGPRSRMGHRWPSRS